MPDAAGGRFVRPILRCAQDRLHFGVVSAAKPTPTCVLALVLTVGDTFPPGNHYIPGECMASKGALAVAILASVVALTNLPAQVAPPEGVPEDLRPLLAPHRSEMRLVTLNYNSDRSLLAGNYAGSTGRGGGGGRGAAAPDTTIAQPIVVSPQRIARLKHFDASWQAALARLDASKLTPEARTELDSVKRVVDRNLARADVDVAELGRLLPAMPFAPTIIGLVEARLRLEDVVAENDARILTAMTRQIGDTRAILNAGLAAGATATLQVGKADAGRAAATVDALRSNLTAWFNFYNGYDPLFTWWMGLPYRHADAALQGYGVFLRDTVGAANKPTVLPAQQAIHIVEDLHPANIPFSGFYNAYDPTFISPTSIEIASGRAAAKVVGGQKLSEIPDLDEILALPQDEMTDVVNRFLGRGTNGGRGGQGGQDPGSSPGQAPVPLRDSTFYQSWLAALTTLDFDHLSRNAQVDYLYLKKLSELKLARQGPPLPADAPRKTDNTGIPGGAAGRDSLIRELQDQLIPYTPEQLMALADKEFAWTTAEMIKASRQMGFGDNWKVALEKTKQMHVPPGGQPAMIRDLIYDAIDYLRANDLITVGQVASESMRMSMMSAQSQLANPFFLGGSRIEVSFPTDGMEFDARQQSMRGNNRPWSHATAFHEMIPGHNLQGYVNQRYADYRANLGAGGPFYGEGWALYWELMLYDKGFDKTPEEKVGALFWRMHRCARIIFSLKFHMGQWSPQEAIDFLVDRVGHERDNATAEVNRSFRGGYGPLYQAAYLLGGLELRGLRRELVDSKQITEKAFHDEILRQGSMPIALLRLGMTKQKLTRDMPIDWKFYGDLPDH